MQALKGLILLADLATAFFLLAVALVAIHLLVAIAKRLLFKTPVPWREYFPKDWPSKRAKIGWGIVLAISLTNFVASKIFATTELGAFYEKREYKETYEAVLHIEKSDKPIFCLAEVNRYADDGRRIVTWLHLPYGHSVYTDPYDEYDIEAGSIGLILGEWGTHCSLSLGDPATDASWTKLEYEIVSNSGAFCGSKNSQTAHLINCRYAKTIKAQNLVYFEDEAEMDVLGYSLCSECIDRYY